MAIQSWGSQKNQKIIEKVQKQIRVCDESWVIRCDESWVIRVRLDTNGTRKIQKIK